MSALKIPDLNLFTDKRKHRDKQYEAVKKQGLTLLQKTVNKQLLADIKGQLYLQNYHNSLKHFVSPTKYKQRAEQILKADTRQEQLLFKAISFPGNAYRCPNCFSKEIERKRCVCQAEQRVLPLLRSKSNDFKPSYLSTNSQRETKQAQQINASNHENQQQQDYQQHRKPLRIETSVVTIDTLKQRMQAEIENLERSALNRQNRRQMMEQNSRFRQELNKREAQLHNIDLNLQDEKTEQLDLRDLIEAKDSYINKSKQILSSLERIIRLGSPRA